MREKWREEGEKGKKICERSEREMTDRRDGGRETGLKMNQNKNP